MQYKYIFFDLDGTLTDPGIGITNSVMYALDKFGIHADRENLYRFIGPPLVDSFMEFYGFPEDKARKAVEYYREYFSVTGLFENKVYDGMEDVLDKLKSAGHKLYVATSKPKVYADRILERFDLKKYFEYVAGADLEGHKSSKSDVVKEAMEISHASSDKILMIGDRKHDIIGARNNGIRTAAVLYGYGNRKEFEEECADYILDKVEDILQFR